MIRDLQPELLDRLAADDPRAIASRRDLIRINAVMRQQAIMARRLLWCPPPRHLLDLGSGDGRFLLGVARRLYRRWPGVTVTLADMKDAVEDRTRRDFAALGWRCETCTGDVFDTLELAEADIVTANLFLHHFSDADLRRLFRLTAARTGSFVACEPRRNRAALAASRMVALLGANDVTRHDAVASVRAGFAGGELSALWPEDSGWTLDEKRRIPFSHVFTARRHAV